MKHTSVEEGSDLPRQGDCNIAKEEKKKLARDTKSHGLLMGSVVSAKEDPLSLLISNTCYTDDGSLKLCSVAVAVHRLYLCQSSTTRSLTVLGSLTPRACHPFRPSPAA